MRVFHISFLTSIFILGCAPGGPTIYPVQGSVEVLGGDVSILAGSHIEAVLTIDPKIRASGEIQSDGSFRLQLIQAGDVRAGAPEGRYQVRLILNDDHRENRRRAAKVVAARFLDFRTSGLTLQVPAEGKTVFVVTR